MARLSCWWVVVSVLLARSTTLVDLGVVSGGGSGGGAAGGIGACT